MYLIVRAVSTSRYLPLGTCSQCLICMTVLLIGPFGCDKHTLPIFVGNQ